MYKRQAGHGPDESARSLCGVPVMPDESDSPLCGVPVMPDESARPSCGMPVGVSRVPCGTSPDQCPSCRASPVRERVPVNTRHLPCPGPTYACSRRRQPRFANVYSFASPWRFMNARSAARLRRGVGRHLNPKNSSRTEAHALYQMAIHMYLLSRRKCGIFVSVKRELQGSMLAFISVHKIKEATK